MCNYNKFIASTTPCGLLSFLAGASISSAPSMSPSVVLCFHLCDAPFLTWLAWWSPCTTYRFSSYLPVASRSRYFVQCASSPFSVFWATPPLAIWLASLKSPNSASWEGLWWRDHGLPLWLNLWSREWATIRMITMTHASYSSELFLQDHRNWRFRSDRLAQAANCIGCTSGIRYIGLESIQNTWFYFKQIRWSFRVKFRKQLVHEYFVGDCILACFQSDILFWLQQSNFWVNLYSIFNQLIDDLSVLDWRSRTFWDWDF